MKKSKAMLKKEKQQKIKTENECRKLKKSIDNLKLFGLKHTTTETNYQPSNVRYELDQTKKIGSNTKVLQKKIIKDDLDDSMIERERLARLESQAKAKRIAPLYNKGAYQYITDETDLKTIGKKI